MDKLTNKELAEWLRAFAADDALYGLSDGEIDRLRRCAQRLEAAMEASCPVCNGDCSAANPPVMNCPREIP